MTKQNIKDFAKIAGIPDDVHFEALTRFAELTRMEHDAGHAQMHVERIHKDLKDHADRIGLHKTRIGSLETLVGALGSYINELEEDPNGFSKWVKLHQQRRAERKENNA